MNESAYQVILDPEEDFNLKEVLVKYLRYWPWFLLSLLLCGAAAYLYMRYAPITYNSSAKVKILEKDEASVLELDPASLLGGGRVNLENEVQVLKSYRLLQQVVEQLRLDVDYYAVGDIKTTQIWEAPFVVEKNLPEDSLGRAKEYLVELGSSGFIITDESERRVQVPYGYPDSLQTNRPFRIRLSEKAQEMISGRDLYKFVLKSERESALQLGQDLQVQPTDKESDILSLSLAGESPQRSEAILNTIIEKFNQDGILDHQRLSQGTLDFIDDRFAFLSQELDSIETGKQTFKEVNQLSYIEADAGITLERKSEVEAEVTKLETQTYLTRQLREALEKQDSYTLLPGDVGLDNLNLNTLIVGYNEQVLERDKLMPTMGENHPLLLEMNSNLERRRANVLKSLNIYEAQLRTSLNRLEEQGARTSGVYSRLPGKERMLRAIERQQNLKENLFMLLLQKREEAAIEVAVTAPLIKVVDYALTARIPASPKFLQVYGVAFVLGLLLPFSLLYLKYTLDTKVYSRHDLSKALPEVPVVAEIPFIPEGKSAKERAERSQLAESFRILGTNVNFMLRAIGSTSGNVVYVTSSVKGEGKTLVAVELARALADLHKKVLIVGADLRNPRLHEYFPGRRNETGLSDFLSDPGLAWKSCLRQPEGVDPSLHVCFSGRVPPNAPQLLAGQRFASFLEQARVNFDLIVVDTAPTLLVTDTLLVAGKADVTLFVVRAGFSEKQLVDHVENMHKTGKLLNMAMVVNDVKSSNSRGYNYGYGYGYTAENATRSWFSRIFSAR